MHCTLNFFRHQPYSSGIGSDDGIFRWLPIYLIIQASIMFDIHKQYLNKYLVAIHVCLRDFGWVSMWLLRSAIYGTPIPYPCGCDKSKHKIVLCSYLQNANLLAVSSRCGCHPCVTVWVQSRFHFSICLFSIVICNEFDVHLFSHYVWFFMLPEKQKWQFYPRKL